MLTTPAFILRAVDYGESDRILTLYTRSLGRVSAMARSARSSRKRFGGALSSFAEFEAVLRPPTRGQLMTLSEATLIDAHAALSQVYARFENAGHILLWLRQATHDGHPDPDLYALLAASIRALETADGQLPRIIALYFLLQLMAHSGFTPALSGCTACGRALPAGRSAFFDPLRGGVVCTACGGGPLLLPHQALAWLLRLARSAPADLADCPVDDATLHAAEESVALFFRHQFS
ncbi:MAG: DNA repair protein RecO [Proteobacteria bacterium]|nr:DNA repair protein RecO [Pseudomonadota bacterium]